MRKLEDLLLDSMHSIEDVATKRESFIGTQTGFPDLDELTYGFGPGELWGIVGDPETRKTHFIASIVNQLKTTPVIVHLSETTPQNFSRDLLASAAHIDRGRVSRGRLADKDFPKLAVTADRLSKANIQIGSSIYITPTTIRDWVMQFPRSIVFVESLESFTTGPKLKMNSINRKKQIHEAVKQAKIICLEQNSTLVIGYDVLGVRYRPNKRPWYTDLNHHGEVFTTHCEVILGLYRDEIYNRQSEDKGLCEVILMKNTKGECNTVRLAYLEDCGYFANLAPLKVVPNESESTRND